MSLIHFSNLPQCRVDTVSQNDKVDTPKDEFWKARSIQKEEEELPKAVQVAAVGLSLLAVSAVASIPVVVTLVAMGVIVIPASLFPVFGGVALFLLLGILGTALVFGGFGAISDRKFL